MNPSPMKLLVAGLLALGAVVMMSIVLLMFDVNVSYFLFTVAVLALLGFAAFSVAGLAASVDRMTNR